MENPIYIGLSRQVALRSHMDLIANNVANMSTPGYRGQNMVFKEYVVQPEGRHESLRRHDPVSMVLDYGNYKNTESGPLKQTGNPLDMALQGPGYFGVRIENEETGYTRAGNFQVNVNGELVTSRGNYVLDEGGGIITVPAGATDIRVTSDGFVATEEGRIGRLMVREFDNLQDLQARGDGIYITEEEGIEAENTNVVQGMVEGSNVKPVLEMTRMIEVSRAYEQTQRMLESENNRLRTMIQRLSRGSN